MNKRCKTNMELLLCFDTLWIAMGGVESSKWLCRLKRQNEGAHDGTKDLYYGTSTHRIGVLE
jgi:hypothetical protein